MVCYMYYTDVFVGSVKIEKLKNALKAELEGSGLTVDLTQLNALASGLEKFIGYSGGQLNGNGIGKKGSYKSSYNGATWENLCKNCKCKDVSNPSRCSCKCPKSVCSNPSQCCPDCNVKKAARVFLCFLPCMWYALKFLKERCDKDESKGGWEGMQIKDNSSLTSLGRFLVGMGYAETDLEPSVQGSKIFSSLSSLINGSDGILDKIYKEVKKYFTSSSHSPVPSPDSPSQPKTVRDILLWLSGLPFTSGFKDLMEHCERLCKPVSSLNFDDFETSLFNSCFLSPFVLAAIEGSKSDEEALKGFPPYKSEWQKFLYPEDPYELLDLLFDYVRKIFVALIFLKFQCERPSDQAGWQDCYFGQHCKTTGTFTSSSGCNCKGHETYLCTWTNSNKNVHDGHCREGKCLGSTPCSNSKVHPNSGSCKNPCPHPLLRFLLDGSSDSDSQSQSPSSPFRLPSSFARLDFSQTPPAILEASSDKFLTMGFKTEQLPSPGRKGRDLYDVLNLFCGSGTSPLTKLFEFSLFVAMRPPETLIELIAFFVKFRLKLKSDLSSKFIDWISKEPGTPDGSALQKAIEKLFNSGSHPSGSSASHPYDLQSLYACDGPKGSNATCGRYLYPLNNINGVFSEKFCGVYLSYVCHLGKALKALLEKFHQKASDKFKCCLSSSSGTSCASIVSCPCALPFLYTYGFTFYQPENLSCPGHDSEHTSGQGQDQYCTRKTCKNFLDQLGKVANGDPFKKLLEEIEKFLWSIRFPFFLFVLAFWAFVISYFLYVHLYKLDLLHLKSHAHFSRSFKILPSTFFSDASSRLKDLSYFTL
ncbi:variant erythrocyte surface antigen-1 family protein [Babesia divergens]|uniref:Variant erythrocyte surface antigen-1 family protein n=1 Tax=Babesia divergens TaxID=32595 RepID=A0AAD9G5F8_BABDI|nr:variant erythrocyte surface antigen-1 family protein [Babesia divergens]